MTHKTGVLSLTTNVEETGLLIKSFERRINELIQQNATIVIIKDNDNASWESGYADFLMNNYHYSNLTDAMRFNLNRKKNA